MTRGWIKVAVLTVSLTAFLGVCCRVHDGARINEMTDCGSRCTLSPRALAERKRAVEAGLGSQALERKQIDDGIAIRFPTDSQTVEAVFDFVKAERRCCGNFITFEVILNGGDGPLWLRLRGDHEAQEFLMDMFNVHASPTIGGVPPG